MITGNSLNMRNGDQMNRLHGNHQQRKTNAGDKIDDRLRCCLFDYRLRKYSDTF